MAAKQGVGKRYPTGLPGVYYRWVSVGKGGKKREKAFYIVFRVGNRRVEELAGRQYRDDMTLARAAALREKKMTRKLGTRKEKKAAEKAEKAAREARWTFRRIWEAYLGYRGVYSSMKADGVRWKLLERFAEKEPKDLRPLDVASLKKDLREHQLTKQKAGSVGYSPQSTKHVLALLRRLARFSEYTLGGTGLTFRIEMPKVSNTLADDLTLEEAQTLLAALRSEMVDIHGAAAMQLAMFTGARKGEVLGLRWSDVDLDRKIVTFRDTKPGRPVVRMLEGEMIELLRGLPRVEGSEYVFPSPSGGRRADTPALTRRLRESGAIPKGHRPWHSLRHTWGSLLASAGVDLYTISKTLGHSTVAMSSRYSHLSDAAQRAAVELGSKLLTSKKDEPTLRGVK